MRALMLGALLLVGCAPPCVPFSRAAHEVSCSSDGGVGLVGTMNSGSSAVLSLSCAAQVDSGVVVAVMTGVLCPGEQFERLAGRASADCALPSLEAGRLPVHGGEVELVTSAGTTECRQ